MVLRTYSKIKKRVSDQTNFKIRLRVLMYWHGTAPNTQNCLGSKFHVTDAKSVQKRYYFQAPFLIYWQKSYKSVYFLDRASHAYSERKLDFLAPVSFAKQRRHKRAFSASLLVQCSCWNLDIAFAILTFKER